MSVSWCLELVEIRVVDFSESLKSLHVDQCNSLTRISGLLYLKNLESLHIHDCRILINVEGLDELEFLENLEVKMCTSLERLIDASCTKIPDNCFMYISRCGDHIIDFGGSILKQPLKLYKEYILQGKRQRDDDHASQPTPQQRTRLVAKGVAFPSILQEGQEDKQQKYNHRLKKQHFPLKQ